MSYPTKIDTEFFLGSIPSHLVYTKYERTLQNGKFLIFCRFAVDTRLRNGYGITAKWQIRIIFAALQFSLKGVLHHGRVSNCAFKFGQFYAG